MRYADTGLGRMEAAPGLTGTCPSCGHPCRPKCGAIVVNHWAHHARADCDPWSEPMTEWHLGWQQAVPPERREVVIGRHRADIVTASGGVVEVQHSAIPTAMIREREDFYGTKMLWIFDAIDAARTGRLTVTGRDGKWDAVRWMNPRRSIEHCRRPVLLDIGNGTMLRLRRLLECKERGWPDTELTRCLPVTRESVERWMRDGGGGWDVRRVPAKAGRPVTRADRRNRDFTREQVYQDLTGRSWPRSGRAIDATAYENVRRGRLHREATDTGVVGRGQATEGGKMAAPVRAAARRDP